MMRTYLSYEFNSTSISCADFDILDDEAIDNYLADTNSHSHFKVILQYFAYLLQIQCHRIYP